MIGNDIFAAAFGITAPGDNTPESLLRVAREATKNNIAVVLLDPRRPGHLQKSPICPLTARDAKKADEEAQEQGLPKHQCGVYHATSDTATVEKWIKRLTKNGERLNLAAVPGLSRLIGVDVDTTAELEGFLADRSEAEGVDYTGTMPTVLSPGQMDQGGTMVHKNGGHFWFTLPDGVEFNEALVGAYTAESGWVAKFGPSTYLLVPPSARNEGSYTLVGQTEEAPRWLLDRIGAAVGEAAQRRKRQASRVGFADDPIDRWNEETTWKDMLVSDGWGETGKPDSCGVECLIWTKPEGAASPKSATGHEPGCARGFEHALHFWTTNMPAILNMTSPVDRMTKLQYVAFRDHGGDSAAAMRALNLARLGSAPADDFSYPPEDDTEPTVAEIRPTDPDRRLHEQMTAAGAVEPTLFDAPMEEPEEEFADYPVDAVAMREPVVEVVEAPKGRPELGEDAKHGLAWDVVTALEPSTEADPNALMFLFLAMIGNYLGKGAYIYQGGAEHYGKVWPLLVGQSGLGRKGTATDVMQAFFRQLDADFMRANRHSGLSSSEGLIRLVADPDEKEIRAMQKEAEEAGETFDPGLAAPDKRKLIMESEFAGVLGRARREGNTLSATVRDAYDNNALQTITSKNPLRADEHHITIVGSITPKELMDKLTDTDVANGFANRFLTVFCHASKMLPRDAHQDKELIRDLVGQIDRAARRAKSVSSVVFTEAGGKVWDDFYEEHFRRPEEPGRSMEMKLRWGPHTLRLALIYALLDGCREIDEVHVKAAAGCWKYVEDSIAHVFDDEALDPDLGRMIEFIDEPDERSGIALGKTRSQIGDQLFRRNKTKKQLDELVRKLLATGKFVADTRPLLDGEGKPKPGRPSTRYVRKSRRQQAEGINS